MANYCANYVELIGRKEVLDKLQENFLKQKSEKGKSFNERMMGVIITKLSTDQKEDLYLFGTRWWDYEVERKRDNLLLLTGDSAWSPPIDLLKYITYENAIDAYIEYQDYDMDLNGKAKIENGRIVLNLDCTEKYIKHNGFKYIEEVNLYNHTDLRLTRDQLDILSDLTFKNWKDLSDRAKTENLSEERMEAERLMGDINEAILFNDNNGVEWIQGEPELEESKEPSPF